MDDRRDMHWSRRHFVGTGIATAVALGLGRHAVAAAEPATPGLALITRLIPATGEQIPVVGLGTNAFGVSEPEDYAARRDVLARMPELGGRLVDTARAYGESEVVIGRALAEIGNRARLFIASKTPISGDVTSGAAVVEESFKRLQIDTIDLMQIHNLHGVDTLLPILQQMKAGKRIRYVGMSTSRDDQYPALLQALGRHAVDFVQVDYSIANRSAAERVLPYAQENGIAVLVNMPFGGRRDGNLFPQVKGKDLPAWCADADIGSWAQFFLKYVISHPAVTCVIPGTTKVSHLEDNQRAARGRLPDAGMRRRMEQFWDAA